MSCAGLLCLQEAARCLSFAVAAALQSDEGRDGLRLDASHSRNRVGFSIRSTAQRSRAADRHDTRRRYLLSLSPSEGAACMAVARQPTAVIGRDAWTSGQMQTSGTCPQPQPRAAADAHGHAGPHHDMYIILTAAAAL